MSDTKIKILRVPGADDNRVEIGVSMSFDVDDPRAKLFYEAFALFVKTALTKKEAREFLKKLNAERAKLAAL